MCHCRLQVKDKMIWRKVKCNVCGQRFTVEQAAPLEKASLAEPVPQVPPASSRKADHPIATEPGVSVLAVRFAAGVLCGTTAFVVGAMVWFVVAVAMEYTLTPLALLCSALAGLGARWGNGRSNVALGKLMGGLVSIAYPVVVYQIHAHILDSTLTVCDLVIWILMPVGAFCFAQVGPWRK